MEVREGGKERASADLCSALFTDNHFFISQPLKTILVYPLPGHIMLHYSFLLFHPAGCGGTLLSSQHWEAGQDEDEFQAKLSRTVSSGPVCTPH